MKKIYLTLIVGMVLIAGAFALVNFTADKEVTVDKEVSDYIKNTAFFSGRTIKYEATAIGTKNKTCVTLNWEQEVIKQNITIVKDEKTNKFVKVITNYTALVPRDIRIGCNIGTGDLEKQIIEKYVLMVKNAKTKTVSEINKTGGIITIK